MTSKANGGPLGHPSEFWNSTATMVAFRSYVRYAVARWGSYTALFAWQLFNEMDGCLGGRTQAATAWLKNITEYIKSIDAHEHMIDNSYAQSPGTEREANCWRAATRGCTQDRTSRLGL